MLRATPDGCQEDRNEGPDDGRAEDGPDDARVGAAGREAQEQERDAAFGEAEDEEVEEVGRESELGSLVSFR